MKEDTYKHILDSIYHAKIHFSDLNANIENKEHNIKWIILSTHHAAETYLRFVLQETDPENSILHIFNKQGIQWYPAVAAVVEELEKIQHKLTLPDMTLLGTIEELTNSRNEIMHRSGPFKAKASIVALPLLLLSRAVRTRFNLQTSSLFDQSPPIEQNLFAELSNEQMSFYVRFMESFLLKQAPIHNISQCVNCAGMTVLFSGSACEACFEAQNFAPGD